MTLSRGSNTKSFAPTTQAASTPKMRPEARIALSISVDKRDCTPHVQLKQKLELIIESQRCKIWNILLNNVIEPLNQLSNILEGLEAVPMTDALHDLEPLLGRSHFAEHLLTTLEGCALVLFTSQDQDGYLDLVVIGWFGINNDSTVGNVAGRVLTEEELSNEC